MREGLVRSSWIAFLVGVLALLAGGPGTAVTAPVLTPSLLDDWLAHRTVEELSLELVKVATFTWTAWTLVMSSALLALTTLGRDRAAAATSRALPVFARRLLALAGAIALSGSLTTPQLAGAAHARSSARSTPDQAVMIHLEPEGASGAEGNVVIMTHLGPATSLARRHTPLTTPHQVMATASTPGLSGKLIVAVGDNFWSIAHRTVSAHLGVDASPPLTSGYWTRLIDANRDRLVDPTNPGLIHPGLVIVLPRV